jgi:hypothetical protein
MAEHEPARIRGRPDQPALREPVQRAYQIAGLQRGDRARQVKIEGVARDRGSLEQRPGVCG